MKKIIILLILTQLSIFSSFAQNPDKALARITYRYIHIQDTNKRNEPHVENMLLLVGKNASQYTSYDKINQDAQLKKNMMEQIKSQATDGISGGASNFSIKLDNGSYKRTSSDNFFYFVKENKFITQERIINTYLVEENSPTLNWKISSEIKDIESIACQKATAYFKGRNWIAWFAKDIPFNSGPWKLNGLPGLIVEAYDEKKEVQFLFGGLEKITSNNQASSSENTQNSTANTVGNVGVTIIGMDSGNQLLTTDQIKLPADGIKATRKEVEKLKEARAKDPQGFINSQLAGRGFGNAQITAVQGTKISTTSGNSKSFEINNPIEL